MNPPFNRNNLKRKADAFSSQPSTYGPPPISTGYTHFVDNRPTSRSAIGNTSYQTTDTGNQPFNHLSQHQNIVPVGCPSVVQPVPHERDTARTYNRPYNQTNNQAFRSGETETLQANNQSKDQAISKLNAQVADLGRCILSKDETIRRLTNETEWLRNDNTTKEQTIYQLSQAVNDLQSINESNEQAMKQASDRVAHLETINQSISQQRDHFQNEIAHLNSIISSLMVQPADQSTDQSINQSINQEPVSHEQSFVKLEQSDDQSSSQSNNRPTNQSVKIETSVIEPISVKAEPLDSQSSNQRFKHETSQSTKQPVNRLKQLAIQAVQQIGKEIGELKGIERIIKRKITGRERRLEAMRSEIAALDTNGPSAEQSLSQLTAHTKDLTDELAEIKSMVSQLNSITSQMLLEPPNHRRKAKEKNQHQSNEQRLAHLNEEIELIHSTSDELLGQASDDQGPAQTIDRLRTELYQLKSINGLNNDAIRSYKQEIEDRKKQVEELQRLTGQIEAGDSTVPQLHAQTKDLTSQLETSNKEIQQLQKHSRNFTRPLAKNKMSKIKAKKGQLKSEPNQTM